MMRIGLVHASTTCARATTLPYNQGHVICPDVHNGFFIDYRNNFVSVRILKYEWSINQVN